MKRALIKLQSLCNRTLDDRHCKQHRCVTVALLSLNIQISFILYDTAPRDHNQDTETESTGLEFLL